MLTQKMHTGSRLCFCKTKPEAAIEKLNLAHWPITEKGILKRVPVSILKKLFQEANKK
jgi:hypothetical protein